MTGLLRRNQGRWLTAAWVALYFAGLARGMDPNRTLSQYIRDHWGVEQGYPGGAVHAFAQTADGYLWIGAEKGLVRFDGSKFLLFNHVNSPALPEGPVQALAATADGDLWILMQNPGVLRYHGGAFQNVSAKLSQPEHPITAMFKEEHEEISFTAFPNGLYRYSGGNLTQGNFHSGVPNFLVTAVTKASDGTVWMGTRSFGLFSLSWSSDSAVLRGLRDRKINRLLPAAVPIGDKGLWIGTDKGLALWDGNQVTEAGVPESLRHLEILSLTEDRESNIWVGTAGGLGRINSTGVISPDQLGGLPITALFTDREENLWIGTTQGIERYRDSVFLTYSALGRPSVRSGAIYADDKNRTWFATSDGGLSSLSGARIEPVGIAGLDRDSVYSISGGPEELWVGRQRGGLTRLTEAGGSFAAKTYTRADGLPEDTIYTVHRSRDGSVWAGTLNHGVSRFQHGHFTTYTTANGLASDSVSSIVEGAGSTMWFATANGLNAFSNDRWRTYTGREGLPSGRINCLLEDSKGVLWIGTSEGLAYLRSDRVKLPSPTPATLREEVLGIAEDTGGWLWMTTSSHLLRVNRDKLLSGAIGDPDVLEYGAQDGLLATEGVKRDRSVALDSLGRIWFSTMGGISVVDPARLTRSAVPAIAQMLTLAADGDPVDLTHHAQVPANSKRIIFTYIGLCLSAPDRVRYRYMLDGVDRTWSVPSAANETGYSNLGPGTYRFHVLASNADGLWNGAEAVMTFEIEPMFWQTWWFYIAVTASCGLAILGLYRYRMRQLSLRFEERLGERERIARELHDTLLQGFQGLTLHFQAAMKQIPDREPARQTMSKALKIADEVLLEGRKRVRDLRAEGAISNELPELLTGYGRELAEGLAVTFKVTVVGSPVVLHPVVGDEIYRIAREAVTNAFRHSKAANIEVEIVYDSATLGLQVRDNGCGIAKDVLAVGKEGHWGLSGMRERSQNIGGHLSVRSNPGAGTELDFRIAGKLAYAHGRKKSPWSWIKQDWIKPRTNGGSAK